LLYSPNNTIKDREKERKKERKRKTRRDGE